VGFLADLGEGGADVLEGGGEAFDAVAEAAVTVSLRSARVSWMGVTASIRVWEARVWAPICSNRRRGRPPRCV
jgi:hypothetical protein